MQLIIPIPITESKVLTITNEVPENDYSSWSGGTTYALGDKAMRTTGVHHNYESLQAGNLNNTPESSPSWWLDLGATNRFKPFDSVPETQATKATPMVYHIAPGVAFNSVAVLNCDNTSVRIQTDNGYDQTVSTLATDIIKTDLSGAAGTHLTVTINKTGGTAKVGEIVAGNYTDLGTMDMNPEVGIIDYSVKEVDEWGNWLVTARGYSKRMNCSLKLANTLIDSIFNLLSAYRAIPVVWVASPSYSCMILLGCFKDFTMVISSRDYSWWELSVEGFTQ